MEKSEYQNIYVNEETHGWYQGMKGVTFELLEKYLPKKHDLKILDAGSGTGLMAKELSKFGQVQAVDISNEAVSFSKKRGVQAKIGSVNKLDFKSETFDLVTSFDVLYMEGVDPKKALSEFNRVLKPNGLALIRVPAFEFLRGRHDLMVHTAHRFTKSEFSNLARLAGFRILKITYVNFFLFFPTLIKRSLERGSSSPKSDIGKLSPGANKFVRQTLKFEGKIIIHFSLPVGVSLIAVLRK